MNRVLDFLATQWGCLIFFVIWLALLALILAGAHSWTT